MAHASKGNIDGYTKLVANNGEWEQKTTVSKTYQCMLGDFGETFWKSEEQKQEQSPSAQDSMKVNKSEEGSKEDPQKEKGDKQSMNDDTVDSVKK